MNPDKGDKQGPVSIAVAVSAAGTRATQRKEAEDAEQSRETRVAAIGDSDFAANAALGIQGNRDLFMNTVNWLAQQESLIAIRPKDAADRRLTMTADHDGRSCWMSLVVRARARPRRRECSRGGGDASDEGLRSTLVLVVLLAGLVGYIYYLNGRESTSTDTKEKAFASVKAEDIEDIRIKAADGQTSRVQKADGTWKIVDA